MARREVLVQLDDELVARLDAVAEQHGTNRSALLRRCAKALLDGIDEAEADATWAESYRQHPQEDWIVEAGLEMARITLPPW